MLPVSSGDGWMVNVSTTAEEALGGGGVDGNGGGDGGDGGDGGGGDGGGGDGRGGGDGGDGGEGGDEGGGMRFMISAYTSMGAAASG